MTTSGDIAPIDSKLNLSSRSKVEIPKFSSYLDKALKNKKKVTTTTTTTNSTKANLTGNTKIIPTKLEVFKTLTEELFYNIQNIIRKNGIDIKSVYVNENHKLNENNDLYNIQYNGFEKAIEFYDEDDCEYVYNGFSEYTAHIEKPNNMTLIFKW